MNPKQTIPLAVTLAPAIAAAAPAVIIGGAIGLGIAWLLKSLLEDDTEKQPETTPAKPVPEISRKPAETAAFRQIPAKIPPAIPVKSAPVISAPSTPRVAVAPVPVRPIPVNSAPVQPVAPAAKPAPSPAAPQLARKKYISRADMATIFENGKRPLSRIAAVAELKRRGFGKSAAYSALSPDGRFSAWLNSALDGIITWTDGHENNPAIS